MQHGMALLALCIGAMGHFPGGRRGMSMSAGRSHFDARSYNYHADQPDYDFAKMMRGSSKGGKFDAKEALQSGDSMGEGLGGLKQQLDGMLHDKKSGNMDNSALKSLVDSLSQMAGMSHASDAHIVGTGANRMYDLRFMDKVKKNDKTGEKKSAKDNIKDFKSMLSDAEAKDKSIEASDPDAPVKSAPPARKGSGKKAPTAQAAPAPQPRVQPSAPAPQPPAVVAAAPPAAPALPVVAAAPPAASVPVAAAPPAASVPVVAAPAASPVPVVAAPPAAPALPVVAPQMPVPAGVPPQSSAAKTPATGVIGQLQQLQAEFSRGQKLLTEVEGELATPAPDSSSQQMRVLESQEQANQQMLAKVLAQSQDGAKEAAAEKERAEKAEASEQSLRQQLAAANAKTSELEADLKKTAAERDADEAKAEAAQKQVTAEDQKVAAAQSALAGEEKKSNAAEAAQAARISALSAQLAVNKSPPRPSKPAPKAPAPASAKDADDSDGADGDSDDTEQLIASALGQGEAPTASQ